MRLTAIWIPALSVNSVAVAPGMGSVQAEASAMVREANGPTRVPVRFFLASTVRVPSTELSLEQKTMEGRRQSPRPFKPVVEVKP
jgi:hypothetical protein